MNVNGSHRHSLAGALLATLLPLAGLGLSANAQCSSPAGNAMELVRLGDVTHTAVTSGDWQTPSTWSGNAVPGNGARVHVPAGRTVTFDAMPSARIETLRLDGTLRFATDVSTELRVDTIVSTPGGVLEAGTAAAPIAADATARVVFIDDGPLNTFCDPKQLGRGAVLMGRTTMHGAMGTHRAVIAGEARAGDTSITLTTAPQGWAQGDELVITGTIVGNPESDEIRTITAVNGTTVQFAPALSLDHVAPQPDLNVYVANLTRNIEFTSENASVPRRGHIMLMHTLDIDVQHARFTRLGRTDKTRPLDDLDFFFDEDAVGNTSPATVVFTWEEGPRTNIRGRYPMHLHRGGIDPSSTPALVKGCVVFDGPGWGFVLHSAHGHFVDNVSYGLQGAGFYTETGDEIGRFEGNIAIRTVNSTFTLDDAGAIDPDLGFDQQEFGNDGDGFWMTGNRVALIGNVSAGATAHGIIYWTDGLIEVDIPEPGRSTVPVTDIPGGELMPGRERIPVWWAPMAECRDNESYGATVGFRIRYIHSQTYMGEGGSAFHQRPTQAYIDTLEPTIDGLTAWNNRDGMLLNYTARMHVRNSRLVGIGAPYFDPGFTAKSGVGLDLGTDITEGFGRIDNVTIEGFEMGLVAPRNHQWTIENLTLRNVTDMIIFEPRQGPRTLAFSNVTFGPLAGTAVAGREGQRRWVQFDASFDDFSHQPFSFVMPDHLSLNGQGLYFEQQAASFVPLEEPIEDEEELLLPIPAGYFFRTNQQLQQLHGLSVGGRILPPGAQTDPRIENGLLGPLVPASTSFPPLIDMTSDGFAPEPFPGGPTPQLTGNRLRIAAGDTVTLLRMNLNTTDTDTGPADLTYTVSNVMNGFFARRDLPAQPIATFTQAEIDAGIIRFVHQGSNAPSYAARVSDGITTTAPSQATVIFTPAPGACTGDITGDGVVDVKDVLAVINGWGATGAADVNGDGTVDTDDLLAVINDWGACPTP